MEKEIIKDLENSIKQEGERLKSSETLASFEKASLEFEKLVERGIAKKRGYNLMTIETKHLSQFSINSNL